jgi:SAM-dependent methyltransferase
LTVSREDIVLAYRLLLGREPSERETALWTRVPSISELRKIFISSNEFQAKITPKDSGDYRRRLPLDLPRIPIEWAAEPLARQELLDYVKATWTTLGEQEPHWSVLSIDEFKSPNIEENRKQFYASGINDANKIAAIITRHGFTPNDFPRAVEYGCGVGRVTPYLASMFEEVLALDISKSHLALATAAAQDAGVETVRFSLVEAPHFGMESGFDLWFSRIVLQHNPPPVIADVLRHMFASLAGGGIAIFQVPTYAQGYHFNISDYLAAPKHDEIEVHCLPQDVIFQLAHDAGCVCLEVREDEGMSYPWLSNMFVFRKLCHDSSY